MTRLACCLLLSACTVMEVPDPALPDIGEPPEAGPLFADTGPQADAGTVTQPDAQADAGPAHCGDGIHNHHGMPVDQDYEECDDGNADETDGCTTACRRPPLGLGLGTYSSCVLGADQKVRCLGRNNAGQLGRGNASLWEDEWAIVPNLDSVVQLVSGSSHSCVRTLAGAVLCWGANNYGQLGDGTRTSRGEYASPIGLESDVEALWVAFDFTCARKVGGETWCWGRNSGARFGNGSPSERVMTPIAVPELDVFDRIYLSHAHSCGLDPQGQAWCWGNNTSGELGDGTRSHSQTPVQVQGLAGDVVSLTAGDDHTCSLHGDGTVNCWGSNWAGQMGSGERGGRQESPQPVPGLQGVSQLFARWHNTCAAGPELGVRCWGYNEHGQVGEPTGRIVPGVYDPEIDGGAHQSVALYLGVYTTCSLGLDGRLFCWGLNLYGGLARPQEVQIYARPVPVATQRRFVSIHTNRRHSCAIGEDTRLYCWGPNPYGQIGDGSVSMAFTPRRAGSLEGVSQVAVGYRHTCALLQNGEVYCWGDNGARQLGLGLTDPYVLTPTKVENIPVAIQVTAGTDSSCAIAGERADLYCWGGDYRGQIGDGGGNQTRTRPHQIGLDQVSDVDLFARTVCAVSGAGQLSCWGENGQGSVGDGTTEHRFAPVLVDFDGEGGVQPAVVNVATGMNHVCAETSDRLVYCWGRNAEGQLGNGTTEATRQPVEVGAFTNLLDLRAGHSHTCLINGLELGESQGAIRCTGWGALGQLGDGLIYNRNTRVAVDLGRSEQVALGEMHSCALVDGQAFCWGYSGQGRLGAHGDPEEWLPRPMLPVH